MEKLAESIRKARVPAKELTVEQVAQTEQFRLLSAQRDDAVQLCLRVCGEPASEGQQQQHVETAGVGGTDVRARLRWALSARFGSGAVELRARLRAEGVLDGELLQAVVHTVSGEQGEGR